MIRLPLRRADPPTAPRHTRAGLRDPPPPPHPHPQKDKKEKREKEPKEKKEKKDRDDKDRKDKKDKKDKKEKRDKGDRDAAAGPSSSKADRAAKSKAASGQEEKPEPKKKRERKPLVKKDEDYMANVFGGMDSSSEEDESALGGRRRGGKQDEGTLEVEMTAKEKAKLRKKELEAAAAIERAKRAAVAESDDMVFDVSYEQPNLSEEAMATATDVKVQRLTIRAKGKLLLENTAMTIAAGRRYGLVGPNGKGKSTLMKMIARRSIPVPAGIDILMVEQEIVGDERTALEAVMQADVALMQLKAEEEEIERLMADLTVEEKDKRYADGRPWNADEASERLNGIYEEMESIGAATAESKASKILAGLGFDADMQKRTTKSFSGGWRMRISLARALYVTPTLLLLDEPTNHLDLRAALWLEEYLTRYKKTLIVVSHDREFLNSITTDIIHLHDLELHQYKGNFEQFEDMYAQRRTQVNKEFDKFTKAMKAAKASGDKSKAKDLEAKSKKDQKKAQDKQGKKKDKGMGMAAADDVVTAPPKKWADYTVHFAFPEPPELNPPLIQLTDVDFKYPGREDFGLKNINLGIDMGSRVAIVGPNGGGKSTLMNLLSGDLEPVSGWGRRDPKLRIGRYNQHFVDSLNMEDTPVSYLMNKFLGTVERLNIEFVRATLGRFGLGGSHHLQPILKLSGGQKARVVFAAIALESPHMLLLDEPTNHLDMESIDALADAIEEYSGGVVIISHDSRLLSRVCDDEERAEVWIVDGGEIEFYRGGFLEYREELIDEICAELDED